MSESRKEIEQWTRDPDEEINLVGGEQRSWIADIIDEAIYIRGSEQDAPDEASAKGGHSNPAA